MREAVLIVLEVVERVVGKHAAGNDRQKNTL